MLICSVTPQKHGPHEGVKLTKTAVFGAHTSFLASRSSLRLSSAVSLSPKKQKFLLLFSL